MPETGLVITCTAACYFCTGGWAAAAPQPRPPEPRRSTLRLDAVSGSPSPLPPFAGDKQEAPRGSLVFQCFIHLNNLKWIQNILPALCTMVSATISSGKERRAGWLVGRADPPHARSKEHSLCWRRPGPPRPRPADVVWRTSGGDLCFRKQGRVPPATSACPRIN